MGPIGALAITRHMVAKLPYDIERDLQPVAVVTRGHLLLAVSPTVPFKSVPELITYSKDNPGKLLNASSSNGSPGHVGGELFKYMSGTDIVHVPYRGGAAAINDLIAGRVHLMFESLNSIAPHARSGAVRALAVSGARRSPGFPDLPTIAEAGVPGYAAPTWSGVITPAGVPRPIIDKLNAAINGGDSIADVPRALRRHRRRAGGGHAGRVRRTDPDGFRQMGRGRAALGRAAGLARK
jgi:tripartite-type tricarboxylate transporter receptor subunit TctC